MVERGLQLYDQDRADPLGSADFESVPVNYRKTIRGIAQDRPAQAYPSRRTNLIRTYETIIWLHSVLENAYIGARDRVLKDLDS